METRSSFALQSLVVFSRRLLIYSPKQVLRYILIGGTAASVQFVMLIIFVEYFSCKPLVANIIGYGFGFMVSFTGHCYWTFKGNTQPRVTLIASYLLLTVLNFTLNQSGFYLLFHVGGLSYPFALVVDLAIVTIITFLINKHWVFRA